MGQLFFSAVDSERDHNSYLRYPGSESEVFPGSGIGNKSNLSCDIPRSGSKIFPGSEIRNRPNFSFEITGSRCLRPRKTKFSQIGMFSLGIKYKVSYSRIQNNKSVRLKS